MYGWWFFMGCLAAAGLALASGHYRRRRAERARIDLCRATVDEPQLSAPTTPIAHEAAPHAAIGPKQPGVSRPPTGDVRCRRRVVLSDPSLSTTLAPGWRLQ